MPKQQKIILITSTIALLLIGSFFSSVYFSQRLTPQTPQNLSQNTESVMFTLKPSRKNPSAGEIVTVSLYAQAPANTQIRSLAAYLKYSPSIEIAENEVYRSTQGIFADWNYIKTKNNKDNSRIEILASYKPLDANPDPKGLLRNTPALFAKIKLRFLGGEPAVLQLITKPATSGAKDPDGSDVPVAPLSLTI